MLNEILIYWREENDLPSENVSGFRPGKSFLNYVNCLFAGIYLSTLKKQLVHNNVHLPTVLDILVVIKIKRPTFLVNLLRPQQLRSSSPDPHISLI